MIAAAQRAAIDVLFSVVNDIDQLKESDNLIKLHSAIEARNKVLEGVALPNKVTTEHAQRAVTTHRDAVAEALAKYFPLLPAGPRMSLAVLGITEVFKRPSELFGTAGLVFAGFGDHDIFPHMIEYRSSGMLEGIPVITEGQRETIDHNTPAALNAFAQTSMSDTFSIGFSEDVYSALMGSLVTKLKEFATAICADLGADLSAVVNLDHRISAATKNISDGWFERARRDHAYPLRRVLGALPIEEIAELAETLVNLQSLKEKVTKPSASVGGPVDVAIITKNEGLVWVKRKLFFDAQMNPRYLYRQQAKYQRGGTET